MLNLFKESVYCHVYTFPIKRKKNEPPPAVCSVCGADLVNRESETPRGNIECYHKKNFFDLGYGVLFTTNLRVFWMKGRFDRDTDTQVGAGNTEDGNTYKPRSDEGAKFAYEAGITPMALSLKPIVSVNVPNANIARIDDYKKLMFRGITLHTKTGESYNFTLYNRGNPQPLKDMLLPLISG